MKLHDNHGLEPVKDTSKYQELKYKFKIKTS